MTSMSIVVADLVKQQHIADAIAELEQVIEVLESGHWELIRCQTDRGMGGVERSFEGLEPVMNLSIGLKLRAGATMDNSDDEEVTG